MRLAKPMLSIVSLILANLIPLAGVLLLGWDAAVIILLYWTENLVIGFYTILKMVLVRITPPSFHISKLLAILFFCIHFGGFCAVHGFFLLVFFKFGGGLGSLFPNQTWLGPLVFVQLLVSVIAKLWQTHPEGMEWPVVGLFVSHGISFVQNYILQKEYISLSIEKLMKQPYKRIVILHIAILIGGMLIMLLGSPLPLLCILILIKICIDIHLHIKSHRIN